MLLNVATIVCSCATSNPVLICIAHNIMVCPPEEVRSSAAMFVASWLRQQINMRRRSLIYPPRFCETLHALLWHKIEYHELPGLACDRRTMAAGIHTYIHTYRCQCWDANIVFGPTHALFLDTDGPPSCDSPTAHPLVSVTARHLLCKSHCPAFRTYRMLVIARRPSPNRVSAGCDACSTAPIVLSARTPTPYAARSADAFVRLRERPWDSHGVYPITIALSKTGNSRWIPGGNWTLHALSFPGRPPT